MSENNTTTTQQQQMVRGTAWLTASNFLSRLLAEQANALFGMGYNIYAVFLLISTAGIPVAIAKQVSKYNALGQEETSYHLLRKILKLTSILGLIFAAIMYLGSPLLAAWRGGGED